MKVKINFCIFFIKTLSSLPFPPIIHSPLQLFKKPKCFCRWVKPISPEFALPNLILPPTEVKIDAIYVALHLKGIFCPWIAGKKQSVLLYIYVFTRFSNKRVCNALPRFDFARLSTPPKRCRTQYRSGRPKAYSSLILPFQWTND